jgi:flagellar biosynthesis protein FlhA
MASQLQTTTREVLPAIGRALRQSDVLMALGVIAILVVLILPLPPLAARPLLALSIMFSVLVLLTALFIEKPLDFRLPDGAPDRDDAAAVPQPGLDAADPGARPRGPRCRRRGDRGLRRLHHGGNFVIGMIVFAILVIVNFVVITKGSGRIAEVAARFSLDAMPGKQMAIDADLSAGLIDEAEAKARRKELEEESAFFGAMDGAAKFVRGDAIAGLLITFINLVAG